MEVIEEYLLKVPKRLITAALKDAVKSAQLVDLIYVKDASPGIKRIKKGKRFHYILKSARIKDPAILDRINKLVIPPAWWKVWICVHENGHLQATGLDLLNRKQYRYHTLWNSLRNHTKFYRMQEFGKTLPYMRQQLQKDLSRKDLCQEKVLATVVSLMERTHIRVGNSMYEKLYGSFGITTLKDKHALVKVNNIRFTFKGKKECTMISP